MTILDVLRTWRTWQVRELDHGERLLHEELGQQPVLEERFGDILLQVFP